MTQQSLSKRNASQPTPPSHENSTIVPSPQKLFAIGANDPPKKREAIQLALHRLAKLVHATEELGMVIAITENIEDMPLRALELAFTHLERTHNIAALPAPAEIRACGMDLWRKEQQSAREGETLREMQELEQRRREHPEEFVPFGEVMQMLRDKCKTAPDPQRTTPQEEAVTGDKAQREAQAKKVALHKAAKP